ncbi:MAG: ribosomal L7Ae/L30e/S12e/Gadd45 family protein [Defluviitaleaceae bacterium]|nr:ribosomal L7Ae/L30e/S12e/Gadd45 family protein [Defluviitaleaceae bacterium]
MNPEAKIRSLLSLCVKAGKLETGETASERCLRNGTACVVIVAGNASDNTKGKFENKCFYYKKPFYIYDEIESLSKCVGKNNRAVFTVTDINFANQLENLLSQTRLAAV